MSTAGGDVAELRIVLVNAPPDAAKTIARALVEKRLAACVNIIPKVTSIYVWEGTMQEDEESTLLIKTRASLVESLTNAVKSLHPYTVPEVVSLAIDPNAGNPAYLAWVRAETTGA